MIKPIKNYYKTTDISLCATLCCNGYQIEKIEKHGLRATFLIKGDENLSDLVKKFWSHDLRIEPLSYFNMLRGIKTRIYQNEL